MKNQIVEEFADDEQAWLDMFVPTLEKMLQNGYNATELVKPFVVPHDDLVSDAPCQFSCQMWLLFTSALLWCTQ